MLAQVGTTDLSGNVVRKPDNIRLQQPPAGAVVRGKPDRLLVEQRRPASADPQKYVQKVQWEDKEKSPFFKSFFGVYVKKFLLYKNIFCAFY